MTPKQRAALAFIAEAKALGLSKVTLGDLSFEFQRETPTPQVKARPVAPKPAQTTSQDPLTNRLVHLTSGERSSD